MRRYLFLIYSLFLLLVLTACQRVIDIKIDPGASHLVIEAPITNIAGAQTITISKTVPYSDANVYPAVSGAVVTINNGSATYTLKETATPGQYTITTLKPRPGQTFNLVVTVDGQTYKATSTMPDQVPLDSIGVSSLSVGNKTVKTVSVFYRDPPNSTDQYRFVLYVNGVQVKQIFTVNDDLTNGRIVNNTLYQDDIILSTGNKVDVEMQCIDNEVFKYWFTLSQQGGNGPNNSATPSNPISNISNGALGYFSAHTLQKKSIVVL